MSHWTNSGWRPCSQESGLLLLGAHSWTTLIHHTIPKYHPGMVLLLLSSSLKNRLSLIVRVNVVLNRTVVVDSDWRFDNLCGSHLQSQTLKMTTAQDYVHPDDQTQPTFWIIMIIKKNKQTKTNKKQTKQTNKQTKLAHLLLVFLQMYGLNMLQWRSFHLPFHLYISKQSSTPAQSLGSL